jgi:beta-1,4-mannosyl-glycoprotein beta-1,4-N-acetylglucosaminyltransferase
MYEVRLNVLADKVDKFIVTESTYSHSGEKKKLNFDINNYPKFKNKIIYVVIDKEPDGIVPESNNPTLQRSNSLKRIALSYDESLKALKEAEDNDFIMLSDNDEIPNLNSMQFINNKSDIVLFNQLFFYYKFNLLYDKMIWPGTKGCKKKKLKSLSWLRNINFGHHDEFRLSGITIDKIANKVKNKELFYNHFIDSSNQDKWKSNYKLKKVDINNLPEYLINNQSKYIEWFDI